MAQTTGTAVPSSEGGADPRTDDTADPRTNDPAGPRTDDAASPRTDDTAGPRSGATADDGFRVVSGRRSLSTQMRELWRHRELLASLVRKELKVKYKNSALGFLWSLLNPALYLVVFTLVFQVFLKSGIPRFGIFLLTGLLVWNLFSVALGGATASVVGNSALVNRVSFPREILPLSVVGATLVHFFLQATVLVLALVSFRHDVSWSYMVLVPIALATLLVLLAAFAIGLSAINVFARDTQHMLELVLLAWFWMTPIVYAPELVTPKIDDRAWLHILYVNPIRPIVLAFQKALYAKDCCQKDGSPILADQPITWYLWQLGIVALAAVALLVGALALFARLEGRFAEEL
jgi:ABC-2 type transport system permease protein